MHSGPVIARNGKLEVIDCGGCGYAHLYPLPALDTVLSLYVKDEVYTSGGRKWFKKEQAEYDKGLWQSAFDFRIHLLGCGALDDWLIDWGCGAGWFLARWREHGGESGIGIEPSLMARLYRLGRGVAITKNADTIIERGIRGNVHLSLVLEHIQNPSEFLGQVASAMRPGDRVVIVVPNEFNPLQKKLLKKTGADWFVHEHHINYFTGETIVPLIEKAGLKVVYRGSTCPVEMFAVLGVNYVGHTRIGAIVHSIRLLIEKMVGQQIFSLYGWLHRKYGWGRELLYVGEKV